MQTGVHMADSGRVMVVQTGEGFAGSLDRIRDCSKVESRLWVNRAEMAAIVLASEP